jgi:glucose/arabinose dehydrogenase
VIALGIGAGSAPTAAASSVAPGVPARVPAQVPALELTTVAPAAQPTAFAVRPGDSTLYVAEQGGRVIAIRDGRRLRRPVLDLTGRIAAGGEQGLLGLAFSPDAKRVYVHYTARNGATQVDEYAFRARRRGGGTVSPRTRRRVLTVRQPGTNHNGGQLAFGPDGALYLGLGDGGAYGDTGAGHAPEGNAQSPHTLLGKIVRFDPTTGEAQIFASGLRNPWRFSFDRANGDLWIGDVGQDAWEEIDHVPFRKAHGANFGWPLLEGSHPFRRSNAPETVLPVFDYDHDHGACAVVGGFVYRGSRIPALRNTYLFTDNCDGRIRALRLDGSGDVLGVMNLGISVPGPTSFGEDADGEIYVLSAGAGVSRLDPAGTSSPATETASTSSAGA